LIKIWFFDFATKYNSAICFATETGSSFARQKLIRQFPLSKKYDLTIFFVTNKKVKQNITKRIKQLLPLSFRKMAVSYFGIGIFCENPLR